METFPEYDTVYYQRTGKDSCWLAILYWVPWKFSTWHSFCSFEKPTTYGKVWWSSGKCSSYCQNVSNHWMYHEIRSNQDGGAWAMLCASKFLHDRLCITRQDTTIQPCGSATLQQSSVILYLLVPLCICKGHIDNAVITTKHDHWRMFRMAKTRISWFRVTGWDHKTCISLPTCAWN